MSIFARFAHRWAMYKTYSEFKEHAATAAIGQLLADQMDHQQAPNYVEMTFSTKDGREFVVTVRRLEGETPHQLRKAAEAQASELLQVQGRLVEFAQSFEFLCDEGFVLMRMPNLACGAKYTLALGGTNDKLLLDGIRHLEELRTTGLKAAGVQE